MTNTIQSMALPRLLLAALFGLVASVAGYGSVHLDIKADQPSAVLENDLLRIECDLAKGTFSGTDKSAGAFVFREARFRLDPGRRNWKPPRYTYRAGDLGTVEDCGGHGRRLRFWMIPHESYLPTRFLDLTVYEGRPYVVLGWGVRNEFSHPVRVRNAEVLSNGRLFNGRKPPADARVLRSGAGAEPNFVEPTWKIEADNGAMMTWRENGIRHTMVAGGLRYAEFARKVEWQEGVKRWSFAGTYKFPGGPPQMTLIVWDPQGKRIPPGETWISQDTFYLDFVTRDPFVSLEHYGKLMAAANAARPNSYPFPTLCGWAVSNGHLGEGRPLNNSPGLVGQAAAAQRSGIYKYTGTAAFRLEPDYYCYGNQGNTQQGWWDDEHWARYGSLRSPYETFAKFCRAVEEYGGIVFTYFQSSLPSNDFAVAHPDWMLNNDISLLHVPHSHQLPLVRYDYTDPGFRAYVLAMWQRLRAAGVRGIKFDYPETAWAWHGGFEDQSFTTVSAYREVFRLCREGLGPDAFIHERIIGNTTHESVPRTDVCAGIVDLQRIWSDASHFEPEMASRMGLRWYKQGRVFRYYPDCKTLTRPGHPDQPLPRTHRRSLLTLVGLLGGRIELATSFERMTPEMIRELGALYPVLPNGRAFRPVDLLVAGKHPRTYVYRVTPDWAQVILTNPDTKQAQTVSAPLAGNSADTGALGLDATASWHVFDFWNQRHRGTRKGRGQLSAALEPGEALVFSLRKVKNHPQIVGASRHVMCGMFELHEVTWKGAENTLSFAADIVGGDPLVVTLAAPDEFIVAKVIAPDVQATHRQDGRAIRLRLDAGGRGARGVPVKVIFRRKGA